jgi:hypothetical protein
MTQQQHHLQSTFGDESCNLYHTLKERSTKLQKNLRHGLSKSLLLKKTVSRLEIEWRWKVPCNGIAQVGAI